MLPDEGDFGQSLYDENRVVSRQDDRLYYVALRGGISNLLHIAPVVQIDDYKIHFGASRNMLMCLTHLHNPYPARVSICHQYTKTKNKHMISILVLLSEL